MKHEDTTKRLGAPSYVDVRRSDHELVVQWRCARPFHRFLLVVALIWCAILVGGVAAGSDVPWFLWCTHVPIGIAMLWIAIAGILNSTTLVARDGTLTVMHQPVPLHRRREIARTDVAQLFVEEARYRVNGAKRWHVCVELANGAKRKLVSGLADVTLASSLEKLLEDYLGISDRPVPDEIAKS